MSELPPHALQTIDDFKQKIAEHEREADKFRGSVNLLCSMYGVEPMYQLVESGASESAPASKIYSVKPDEFFGKPFSTCVREILAARKARDLGPADPREIFEMLRRGGFAFDNKDDEAAFRGMQISIGKNSAVFVRLPSGQIGLEEWYERTRRPKARNGVGAGASSPGVVTTDWPTPEAALKPPAADGGADNQAEEDQEL